MSEPIELTYRPNADSEDACVRCGRSLFGIAEDQPCPGCGLLAYESEALSDMSARRYVRRLSIGVWLVIAAIVVLNLLLPLAIISSRKGGPISWIQLLDDGTALSGLLFGTPLFFIGTWFLGAANRGTLVATPDRVLRLLSAAPLIAWMTASLVNIMSGVWYQEVFLSSASGFSNIAQPLTPIYRSAAPWVVIAVLIVSSSALPWRFCNRLAYLSRQFLGGRLNGESRVLAITIPTTTGLFIGSMVVSRYGEAWGLGDMSLSTSSDLIAAMLLLFLVATGSGLWTVILLLSFAVRFRRLAKSS